MFSEDKIYSLAIFLKLKECKVFIKLSISEKFITAENFYKYFILQYYITHWNEKREIAGKYFESCYYWIIFNIWN